MNNVTEELTPDTARRQLVEQLTAKGRLTRPDVAAAFLAVPRHEFAPAGTSVRAAYADDVVVTKRNAAGQASSSISAPWLSLSTLIVLWESSAASGARAGRRDHITGSTKY